MQISYEDFKISLAKIVAGTNNGVSRDHAPIIEVLKVGLDFVL